MAEKSHLLESVPANITTIYIESDPESEENNVVYGNFLPHVNRCLAMKHIGEMAAAVAFWFTGEDGNAYEATLHQDDVLWSEPIGISEDSKGNIDIRFKQYRLGASGDTTGANMPGYRGTENLAVVSIHWDALTRTVTEYPVEARNLRYQLPSFEARKRSKQGHEELEALRRELEESRS